MPPGVCRHRKLDPRTQLGQCREHVNWIKMLKRQMSDRVNLDLLRERVIHLE